MPGCRNSSFLNHPRSSRKKPDLRYRAPTPLWRHALIAGQPVASRTAPKKPTASERCCVEMIIDALVDLTSPALKTRLAATESALAAAKSEREEAAKRLETAKAKHRDL